MFLIFIFLFKKNKLNSNFCQNIDNNNNDDGDDRK